MVEFAPKLGGEVAETTVLAVLLRNKDRHVASLSPEEELTFLNKFYQPLVHIIIRQDGPDGLVAQYLQNEGGLLAWFGYPSEYQDYTRRALTAARDMVRSIRNPLAISIGIDTGKSAVGNTGSSDRLQFGITGNVVIKTLQIAQVARQREIDILISDSTLNSIGIGDTILLLQSFEVALSERRQATLVHSLSYQL